MDENTGLSIIDAEVYLPDLNLTTHTDIFGFYRFNDLTQGSCQVVGAATGYESKELTVQIENNYTRLDISLGKLYSPLTVEGFVKSQHTGIPVTNATVAFGVHTTQPDASGYYRLTNLTGGIYSVSVTATGYKSYSQNLNLNGSMVIDFHLDPYPSSIQGLVISYSDLYPYNHPVNDTVVTLTGYDHTGFQIVAPLTNLTKEGMFKFEGLAPADYKLELMKLGYFSTTRQVSLPPQTDLDMGEISITCADTDVKVRVYNGAVDQDPLPYLSATIAVYVNGQPVPFTPTRSSILLKGFEEDLSEDYWQFENASVKTFKGVMPGRYLVKVMDSGVVQSVQDHNLTLNPDFEERYESVSRIFNVTQNEWPYPTIDVIVYPKIATLRLKVMEVAGTSQGPDYPQIKAIDMAPVEGANITIVDGELWGMNSYSPARLLTTNATTGPDGEAKIRLYPGTYTVNVTYGEQSFEGKMCVGLLYNLPYLPYGFSHNETHVTVYLCPNWKTYHGTVRGDLSAYETAHIMDVNITAGPVQATTDNEGYFVLPQVPRGVTVNVTVSHPAFNTLTETLSVSYPTPTREKVDDELIIRVTDGNIVGWIPYFLQPKGYDSISGTAYIWEWDKNPPQKLEDLTGSYVPYVENWLYLYYSDLQDKFQEIRTDTQGNFEFTNVPSDIPFYLKCRTIAHLEPYPLDPSKYYIGDSDQIYCTVQAGDSLTVYLGACPENVTVPSQEWAVHGIVTDSYGVPQSEVTLEFNQDGSPFQVTTSQDGRYNVTGLEGQCGLTVTKPRFVQWSANLGPYGPGHDHLLNIRLDGEAGQIKGSVTNMNDHTPIQGASITLNRAPRGSNTYQTNSTGGYETEWIKWGTYDIAVTAIGFRPLNTQVTLEGELVTKNIELEPLPPPEISQIEVTPRGYILQGISGSKIKMTANVTEPLPEEDPIIEVEFFINKGDGERELKVKGVSAEDDIWEGELDSGILPEDQNCISVVVRTKWGAEAEAQADSNYTVNVVAVPGWLAYALSAATHIQVKSFSASQIFGQTDKLIKVEDLSFTAGEEDGYMNYGLSGSLGINVGTPNPHELTREVGNKYIGVEGIKMNFEIGFSGEGEASIEGGVSAELEVESTEAINNKLMNHMRFLKSAGFEVKEVSFEVGSSLGGSMQFDPPSGEYSRSHSGELTVKLAREIPLTVPALKLIQEILSKLNIAELVVFTEIKPNVGVTFTQVIEPNTMVTVPRDETWGYTPVVLFDLETEFKELTGQLGLDLMFGAGVTDLVTGTVSGGLKDAAIVLGIPPPIVREISFNIVLVFKAGLKDWFELQKTIPLLPFQWTPSGSESFALMSTQTPLGWRLIERHWSAAGHPSINVMCSNGTTGLVEDIYPNSELALGLSSSSSGLLLSVQDDLSKSFPSSLEISYSTWDSSNKVWTTSTTITDDGLVDFRPAVEFGGSGKALAVWQTYMDLSAGTGMNPFVNLKNVDLRYAVWNGTHFTQPQKLTSNEILEHFMSLASDNAGNVMAVWVSDKDGGVFTVDDGDLYYAIWDGVSWSTSDTIAEDVEVASTPTLTFHDGEAVLAFVRDIDGNLTTREDHEIYYATYNGADWSPIQPVTNNTVREESPSLAVDSTGEVSLTWVSKKTDEGDEQGRDIIKYTQLVDGNWSAPQTVTNGLEINAVKLLIQPGYNPMLFWTDVGPASTSTTYYSQFAEGWSEPQIFTSQGYDHKELAVDVDRGAEVMMAVTVAGVQPLNGSDIPQNIYVTTAELPSPPNITVTLPLKAGWNMISLPVIPENNSAPAVLNGTNYLQLVAWNSTGKQYVEPSTFEAGGGYWVLVPSNVNLSLSGQSLISVQQNLTAGWNMVGGSNSNVNAGNVFHSFYQLVTWDQGQNGYIPSTTLNPCKGYWILVFTDETITVT